MKRLRKIPCIGVNSRVSNHSVQAGGPSAHRRHWVGVQVQGTYIHVRIHVVLPPVGLCHPFPYNCMVGAICRCGVSFVCHFNFLQKICIPLPFYLTHSLSLNQILANRLQILNKSKPKQMSQHNRGPDDPCIY